MKKVVDSVMLSLVSLPAFSVEVNPNQVEIPDTEYLVPIAITIIVIFIGFCYYYFRSWDEEEQPPADK
jgi:RsiW-degrading membrane proteinase PrsW (M82 family)